MLDSLTRIPVVDVELNDPPDRRWTDIGRQRRAVKDLAERYVADAGGAALAPMVAAQVSPLMAPDHLAEIHAIAEVCDVDPALLLTANAYYDVVKHAMMCTAFALDRPSDTLHARNLDWWSPSALLSKTTQVVRYRRAGEIVWESVGWPGFVGTLTGVAPGRFAVSLNAVISADPAEVTTPVALVLRELLEDPETHYRVALTTLANRPLACDALLLLSGCSPGERCVIERTPSRSELREAHPDDSGVLVVTNGYRALDPKLRSTQRGNALLDTTCDRYTRAQERAQLERPGDAAKALAVLSDDEIRMEITVQQVVMSAREGLLAVRAPGKRDAKLD